MIVTLQHGQHVGDAHHRRPRPRGAAVENPRRPLLLPLPLLRGNARISQPAEQPRPLLPLPSQSQQHRPDDHPRLRLPLHRRKARTLVKAVPGPTIPEQDSYLNITRHIQSTPLVQRATSPKSSHKPSPKFPTIRQTAQCHAQIPTARIRLQMRQQFGPGQFSNRPTVREFPWGIVRTWATNVGSTATSRIRPRSPSGSNGQRAPIARRSVR